MSSATRLVQLLLYITVCLLLTWCVSAACNCKHKKSNLEGYCRSDFVVIGRVRWNEQIKGSHNYKMFVYAVVKNKGPHTIALGKLMTIHVPEAVVKCGFQLSTRRSSNYLLTGSIGRDSNGEKKLYTINSCRNYIVKYNSREYKTNNKVKQDADLIQSGREKISCRVVLESSTSAVKVTGFNSPVMHALSHGKRLKVDFSYLLPKSAVKQTAKAANVK